MPLTPNNREEHWLQGMVDGSTDLTPNKRREYWYKEIVDAIGSGGGGGGGGILYVTETSDILSATFAEITAAVAEGKTVIRKHDIEDNSAEFAYLMDYGVSANGYTVRFFLITYDEIETSFGVDTYTAESATGNLVYS